jgi:hypothetical protein
MPTFALRRETDGKMNYFDRHPQGCFFVHLWCGFVADEKKENRQPTINQRFERLNHV